MKPETIHSILRNRLFDYTRRSRLLYFKPSLKHLNLTISSVPLNENYTEIDMTSLFIWNDVLSKKMIASKDISLSQYIPVNESIYALSALNRIRLQANKDINEYGFSQLRLVISFLNWCDVKNNMAEKIISPLLLVPVQLVKKKGVKDEFILQILDTEAEINPVLAGRLKDLYNIILPEKIELSETVMADLFRLLKKQIEDTSDVTLTLLDQPDVEKIHWKAVQLYQKHNNQREQRTSTILDAEIIEAQASIVDSKQWEFDISNIVLGNFRSQKMSLVRDYDSLMDQPQQSEVFNQLFNDVPAIKNIHAQHIPFANQFHVIQADPTQQSAIAFASKNESYIIQGPPGTGKSQTITNLIADFVSKGKKMLFVCEKRAAIDVVYFRLKQKKLDEFCSLIHDSQADKKEFIMNLKKTAESYTKFSLDTADIAHQRNQIVYKIERELYAIRLFHSFMKQRLEKAGLNVRELLDIVISTRKYISKLEVQSNQFPGYDQWVKYGGSIQKISLATQQCGYQFFSQHPLSLLHESCYYLYGRSKSLQDDLSDAVALLNDISAQLKGMEIPDDIQNNISALKKFIQQTASLTPFQEVNMLALLEKGSELDHKFSASIKHLESLEKSILDLLTKNINWTQKFTPTDTENALEIIQKHEGTFFSFLFGNYRRSKKAISKAYDFSKHQIKPSHAQVLNNLKDEYDKQDEFDRQKISYEQFFKLGELYELQNNLNNLYNDFNAESIVYLQQKQNDKHVVNSLKKLQVLFEELDKKLGTKLALSNAISISQIGKIIQSIIGELKHLPLFLPHLKELSTAEVLLKNIISKKQYSAEQIEALLAQSSIERFFQLNPEIQKIEGVTINHHINKIEKLYEKFMQINALYIRSKQRERYQGLVRASELSVAGRSDEEKEEKRLLSEGRKILQNEFDKTMRYKSIRDLASLESGKIIRELKPVWLMSPLSVSDTLPLEANYFDVVIFDEASQITLEESIPSIYRAPQIIIVGDEMQMPPSHFFSSTVENEESEKDILNAESFLQQGARKFPSIMLGWHYRSQQESLVGFSNAAFYENRLLTIPDYTDQQKEFSPIVAEKKEDAVSNLSLAFQRPISYHYLRHGIYDERSNIAEAEYIAEMVREIIKGDKGLSIGVVAFSKEQQNEIEDAILRLCDADDEFERNLEDEYKRMEEDQFVGLFFKNLENVQGDERDIIIMSTCYGYDVNGKMRMNFGPINRVGGEKRLNVLFSRAKKHMLVISSIRHDDIKNEHNTGSNYFKKYLQYAEHVSLGNMKMADAVLKNVISKNVVSEKRTVDNTVLLELKSALESNGYIVKANIGQSNFKCHLGIKKSILDESFTAGILLDDEWHYASEDVLEPYFFKPQLLKKAGWHVIQVFSKDWYTDREKVLKQVLYSIAGKTSVVEKNEDLSSEIIVAEQVSNIIQEEFIRLENHQQETHHFWEIRRDGNNLILQYGKVGSTGTRMVKSFGNRNIAEKEMKRMVQIKIKVGYIKVR